MTPHRQIVIGAPYDNLNGLTRPSPQGIGRPLRVALHIREDGITTLAANCLDGGFEMLAIFHGASPDGEMFASDRFMRTGHGKVICGLISRGCGRSANPCHWSNG